MASSARFTYAGYAASAHQPNVVVDGSPNDATVLTLTHWPGFPQPAGFHFDLSAEMAYHYVDEPIAHSPADIVTNNHFDQDGLVGVHALVDPVPSFANRPLLLDIAAAGDFATFHDRRAARASMVIAAYADPGRSPIAGRLVGPYDDQCVVLYEETLPLLVPMAVDGQRFHELWADEDAQLTESAEAIAKGTVTIEEVPDVGLAVVTIPASERSRSGHRFAGESFDGVHPMALHGATDCLRLLIVHGRRYQFVDRYETWVQFRSRPTLPRVDMRPLVDRLMDAERGSGVWTADSPGSLTPTLRVDSESTVASDVVRNLVIDHLRQSPPAWNPYVADPA